MKILFGKNLKYLRKKKALNQSELADFVGKGHTTIGNWESGNNEPSFLELTQISNFFEISVNDFLYVDLENGNLLDKNNSGKNTEKSNLKGNPKGNLIGKNEVKEPLLSSWNRVPQVVTIDSTGVDNVVMVPTRARAGYLAGYADPEFIQTLPSYRLPGVGHGTFRMFEVSGQSMIPTYHESDIVVCRYVDNFLEIRDDRIYVIVSKRDGVVIKRVVNRVQRDGKLILNSDNQRHPGEYSPIVLDPEDVLEIWYVVMYMSRQMRAPGEMYNRLIDVESRLTLLEHDRKKSLPK